MIQRLLIFYGSKMENKRVNVVLKCRTCINDGLRGLIGVELFRKSPWNTKCCENGPIPLRREGRQGEAKGRRREGEGKAKGREGEGKAKGRRREGEGEGEGKGREGKGKEEVSRPGNTNTTILTAATLKNAIFWAGI